MDSLETLIDEMHDNADAADRDTILEAMLDRVEIHATSRELHERVHALEELHVIRCAYELYVNGRDDADIIAGVPDRYRVV